MGGSSGGGWNLFNTGVRSNLRPLFMVLDPGGGLAQTIGMVGGEQAQERLMEQPKSPEVNTPTAEDPAIAEAAATEAARVEEMRKRRLRVNTLLSDQEDQGTATVGTKVLLGG
jgi:hypothetical protein